MIEVKEAGKHFEDKWILRRITFDMSRGESMVLIGPSGSGKSVLLKIIAGLITPDEGYVKLGSSNIGMLFQQNALFNSLSVIENLLFPLGERLGLYGTEARHQCAALLEAVGLLESADLYPDEISGGMQKRLGIARALIVKPEIILYDEPTAGLDPITSRLIADLILGLRKKEGSTIITVTNDINRAYQLADRIALIARNTMYIGGTPDDVRQSRDPALKQFIYGLKDGPLNQPGHLT
ncbi:MAG: ATP-binding cassette domain-containing protein [Bdellovibrionota bacterium]